MSVLLQISDTHFGTERPAVVHALLELAAELRPQVLVLSGDITQRARRRQFDAARALVDALGVRHRVVVPGNHDLPLFNIAARLLDPYGGYARVFGRNLEPECETDRFLVLGVNTTRARRHKHGEVAGAQVERVAQRLRACPAHKLRVVVTHHPMHVPAGSDERNLLRGHGEAARAWALAGADLLLGGHIHLPFVRSMRERLPDLPRELWVAQAGTAVSHRVRPDGGAANSVNVVRSHPGAFTVERWDHEAARRCFVVTERRRLDISR